MIETVEAPGVPESAEETFAHPSISRETFLRAADILGERGWCQGSYVNEDGRVCMLGAIGLAVFEAGISNPIDPRVNADWVRQGKHPDWGNVAVALGMVLNLNDHRIAFRFNDKSSMTETGVREALRRLAYEEISLNQL